MIGYESVEEKDANSAICTKIRSVWGGQDAQNETCARLSKSNSNENLDGFWSRFICNRLAYKNQRVRKVGCLFGFLMFFGLLLNSQNNLFAATLTLEHRSASGNFPEGYYDTTYGVRYEVDTSAKTAIVVGRQQVPSDIANKEGEFWNVVIPDKVSYTEGGVTTEYTVKGIAQSAFNNYYCNALSKKLKNVNIQATSLESIGWYAFSGCSSLTSVEIPEGVESIEYAAFSGCSSLSEVIAKGDINSIEDDAFSGCIKLGRIVALGKIEGVAWGACDDLGTRYTVKYQDGDGTTVMTGLVFINNRTTAANPAKYGLIATWTQVVEDKIGGEEVTSSFDLAGWTTQITENLIVKCSGSKFFDVTFQDKDEKVVLTEKVESGKSAIDPKEYGIFATWYQVVDGVISETAFTAWGDTLISADLTLKCKNSIHEVTFNPAGGSPVDPQAVESGKTAEKPNDPTKTGFVFVSWLKNGTEFDFNTAITGPITLTAKWIEVVPLTLNKTFKSGGEEFFKKIRDKAKNAGQTVENFLKDTELAEIFDISRAQSDQATEETEIKQCENNLWTNAEDKLGHYVIKEVTCRENKDGYGFTATLEIVVDADNDGGEIRVRNTEEHMTTYEPIYSEGKEYGSVSYATLKAKASASDK